MLADSNILILAASASNHPLQEWLIRELPGVSVITRVETLGYHRLRAMERLLLEELLGQLRHYGINGKTVELAIGLRQQRKMSLGDALIAATCQEHRLTLATQNVSDFSWIPDLVLFDPMSHLAMP